MRTVILLHDVPKVVVVSNARGKFPPRYRRAPGRYWSLSGISRDCENARDRIYVKENSRTQRRDDDALNRPRR